jgi:hypothetical protein
MRSPFLSLHVLQVLGTLYEFSKSTCAINIAFLYCRLPQLKQGSVSCRRQIELPVELSTNTTASGHDLSDVSNQTTSGRNGTWIRQSFQWFARWISEWRVRVALGLRAGITH